MPTSVAAVQSQVITDPPEILDTDTVLRQLEELSPLLGKSREELEKVLSDELGRKIILLEQSPEHHAGMFMMVTGNRTVVVADPELGRNLIPAAEIPELPGGADFSQATQGLYDAVAKQVAAAGYRVVRIPQIPAADGKTFLTYLNVIIDCQKGKRIVYMPEYRGVEKMNQAARKVWEGLGYEVRPIDCTNVFRQFGTLHCLVNVVERS